MLGTVGPLGTGGTVGIVGTLGTLGTASENIRRLLLSLSYNLLTQHLSGLFTPRTNQKFCAKGTNDCHTRNAYLNFRGSSKILENSELLENF